jgi:hypothetical protein
MAVVKPLKQVGSVLIPYSESVLTSVPAETRNFYLNVILERVKQTFNTRGPGKPKVVTESKPGPQLPILELTRKELVVQILEVHGLQECYIPGPISGPPFRLTFKGLPLVNHIVF